MHLKRYFKHVIFYVIQYVFDTPEYLCKLARASYRPENCFIDIFIVKGDKALNKAYSSIKKAGHYSPPSIIILRSSFLLHTVSCILFGRLLYSQ